MTVTSRPMRKLIRSQIMKSKKGIVSIAVGNVLTPFFQVIFAFLK